ncbi:cell division protein FtsQ/DivIB [Haloplasma contractile]|uniref:Cell division protein DivIB n=1 Tax=Haloplasma contractile SSD-17B TaxID=1033810 RepID=F7Q1B8_9MOLU|nr:FtsQ-type POTRA domain-containing protein [Haloplasma contractile]ERJ12834.1 Cell division protein DivIB [Haloplasma contractile SSD-17B]
MAEYHVLGKMKRFSLYSLLSIVALGVTIYLFTDYKYVDTILVEGNYYVSEEDVIIHSGLNNDQLFLAIDQHKIEFLVTSHPVIQSVTMTKQFPNDIKIEVLEHKVIGCLEEENNYFQLFSNGYREQVSPLTSCQGSIITGVNAYFNDMLLESFINEFSKIGKDTLSQISETIYSPNEFNKNRIISYMTDGNKIIYTIDTIHKLNYYKDMVNQIYLTYDGEVNGVFDFEVGAYFTPYDTVK